MGESKSTEMMSYEEWLKKRTRELQPLLQAIFPQEKTQNIIPLALLCKSTERRTYDEWREIHGREWLKEEREKHRREEEYKKLLKIQKREDRKSYKKIRKSGSITGSGEEPFPRVGKLITITREEQERYNATPEWVNKKRRQELLEQFHNWETSRRNNRAFRNATIDIIVGYEEWARRYRDVCRTDGVVCCVTRARELQKKFGLPKSPVIEDIAKNYEFFWTKEYRYIREYVREYELEDYENDLVDYYEHGFDEDYDDVLDD